MAFSKTFKIVIAGDGGVGKTSLTNKYITGIFNESSQITIGVDFFIKDLEIENIGVVRLQIWDFGGEERFRFILPSYMRGANGILFLYSITDPATLMHFDDWSPLLRTYDQNIPILLAGSKADLVHMRKVPTNEAIDFARSRGCIGFVEVSAKTGLNIEEAFDTLTKIMIKNSQK
ncbi:MAG: GTP-binding protein [Promethearchaeota archaeon]